MTIERIFKKYALSEVDQCTYDHIHEELKLICQKFDLQIPSNVDKVFAMEKLGEALHYFHRSLSENSEKKPYVPGPPRCLTGEQL